MSKNTKDTLDQSYLIYIRSKDCNQLTSGFNTNMSISFDYSIKRINANQDFHLSLSTAHIPFTFFQFSSNLENLIINVDGLSSFILYEGNYDIYELVDLITLSTFPYSATYNENNNKITLLNTDTTTHTINFTSSSLYKNLGFTNEDIVVLSGGSITSYGSINLQTIHTLYIHSDFSISNILTSETKNISNIIDSVNVDVNPFEIISHGYYESAPFSSILDQQEIRKFTLSLKDQNGRLIQMNNANFELSLLIELHDRDNKDIPTPIQGRRAEMVDIQNIPLPINPSTTIRTQPAPTTTYTRPRYIKPQITPISENNIITPATTTATTTIAPAPATNNKTNEELNNALLMASILTI